MNGQPSHRHETGFTLLEMLVTLTLLSLLSLALFGSLQYGSRVWQASHASAANTDAVRAAQAQISSMVSAAYPKLVLVNPGRIAIAFSGDRSSLKVLAPDPRTPGAMDEITIHKEETARGGALVIVRRLELAASSLFGRDVLLIGLTSLRFDYFGPEAQGTLPAWTDSWKDRTRPPLLVRIRAAFNDRRAEWPDLIVRPRIEADMNCRLSSFTGFCEGR